MNKKAWCVMWMIAVFLATSILIAEFMLPWIVIVGFVLFTIFAYGVYEGHEDEMVLEYEDIVESIKQTSRDSLDLVMLELEDTKNELAEWKAKYENLEKMRVLNEQPKPKKSKKKVGE